MEDLSAHPSVAAKTAVRAELLRRRRDLSPPARAAAARALTAHLTEMLADPVRYLGPAATAAPTCVALYAPVGSEPGGPGLPEAVRTALPAATLLLPVLRPDLDLDWVAWDGRPLRPAGRGLREPDGPRRDPDTVRRAELVVVPALAVDRAGHRLGRGGGSYDRVLARVTAPTVALLHDGELRDRIPAEPHDRPVAAAVTPRDGVVRLDDRRPDGAVLALEDQECQGRR